MSIPGSSALQLMLFSNPCLSPLLLTHLLAPHPLTQQQEVCSPHFSSLFSTLLASQNYNTLFTLSHLHDVSDGIITLENDALHRVCTRLMNIPRPSFEVGCE